MTDLLNKKQVLILGLARQGKALARFATAVGADVTVSDLGSAEKLANDVAELADLPVRFVLGEHPLSLLDRCDVIALSGGVPADAPFVRLARERGIALTNDSLEFLRRCPTEKLIGITGAAGKTTTTSLVGEMGKRSTFKSWVGGNIGHPLLSDLGEIGAEDVVVQELSSFQLEIWDRSPRVAAVLNVTPNHLDRHKTMAVYTAAKANILTHQSGDDVAVLSGDDPVAFGLRGQVNGRLRLFSRLREVEDGAFVRGEDIVLRDSTQEQVVCRVDDIQLRGSHNVSNVLAACVLADSVGIDVVVMREAIVAFRGVPHRLEPVGEVDGVSYINDSIATAPERALAAIGAFGEPLVLLAGGRDKKMDWDDWTATVSRQAKEIVLFGDLAPMLQERLVASGRMGGWVCAADLPEAVAIAHQKATAGDVVLLSPGGTSFDAFKDFAERGDLFRELVRKMGDES